MDGTKPNMDSNAEENQDEGQESKGTPRPRFGVFVSLTQTDAPAPARALHLAFVCDTISVF